MKLKTHPHKSDSLTLTKEDLRRIETGEVLQVSALIISLEKEPKPDYTDITAVYRNLNYRFENERLKNTYTLGFAPDYIGDLKLTWDGTTGKLKSAEVL